MKNVLVALACTLGAVACGGENRPAESPATSSTSVTTETTTTTSADEAGRTAAPASTTGQTGMTGQSRTTGTTGATGTTPPSSTTTSSTAETTPPHDQAAGTGGTAPAVSNPGSADNTKDATNTKTNDRDRHGTVTPMDQGGGKDRDITAAIRRAVVSDGSLSFNAKNVKIITTGGKVTLRGPVKSDAEKAAIESKAKSAAGVTEVDNQLEVKK